MQIVGHTTQQVVYAASRRRPFRINELLLIEDRIHSNSNPLGEVVETQSFNRYIPLATEHSDLVDRQVMENLAQLGYDIGADTIHLARIRILAELASPVSVGIAVRVPTFAEIRDFLIPRDPATGLVLGVIRGTEELTVGLPAQLSRVALLYQKDSGIMPQKGIPYIMDHWTWPEYPHIGIFGGSGSGKSFALRVLLEELMRQQLPGLILDPHFELSFTEPFPDLPASYREDFTRRSIVLMAGRDVGILFEELNAADLINLLQAAGEVTENMNNAIQTLHRRRDSFVSFSTRIRDLTRGLEEEQDLKRKLREDDGDGFREKQEIRRILGLVEKYKDRVGHVSTLRAISRRLNRLQTERIFTGGIESIREAIMNRRLVVVQGPIWFLQVLGAYVIRKFYRERRQYQDAEQTGGEAPKFPPFIVATDEAHNFAPRSPEIPAPARSILRTIAQEGRKYGVFLILATQRPALLEDTITAQLNTKLIFRTIRSSDLEVIREETDLGPEEVRRLPYLGSGNAFVSSAAVGRTIAVRIRVAKTVSPHSRHPFLELKEDFIPPEEELGEALLTYLPLGDFNFDVHLGTLQQELKRRITIEEITCCLEDLVGEGIVEKKEMVLGVEYRRRED